MLRGCTCSLRKVGCKAIKRSCRARKVIRTQSLSNQAHTLTPLSKVRALAQKQPGVFHGFPFVLSWQPGNVDLLAIVPRGQLLLSFFVRLPSESSSKREPKGKLRIFGVPSLGDTPTESGRINLGQWGNGCVFLLRVLFVGGFQGKQTGQPPCLMGPTLQKTHHSRCFPPLSSRQSCGQGLRNSGLLFLLFVLAIYMYRVLFLVT